MMYSSLVADYFIGLTILRWFDPWSTRCLDFRTLDFRP